MCVALVCVALALGCRPGPPATTAERAVPAAPGAPTLLAHGEIPGDAQLEGLPVGGLSDIAYDARHDVYWAVVDDVHGHPPARLLSLRWEPPAAPEPLGWLPLYGADGAPLSGESADLEGLALLPDGSFLISAEGYVRGGHEPWVARFDASGRLQEHLPLPPHFAIAPGRGPRHNAGFEALASLADGAVLAGMEGTLLQDDPDTPPDEASDEPALTRLLRWASGAGGELRELVYSVDPPHARPLLPGAFRVAGLVDLLAGAAGDGGGDLLALERSFVAGRGFRVRLYATDLDAAADVTGRASLAEGQPAPAPPKRLVVDLDDLGVPVDNYEGIAWGKPFGSERVLVIASDNNFDPRVPSHWVALRWPG